jgi:hypothetical protein
VKRDWEKGYIHLSQEGAIIKLAKRFALDNEIPEPGAKTPMDPNQKFTKPAEEDIDHVFPYMSAIGGLLYLSITTRPDIAYSVGVLSRFMSCPSSIHVTAAKRVISYLYHTRTYGIRYSRSDPSEAVGAPHVHDYPQVYCHTRKSDTATQGSIERDETMVSAYVDADLGGDRDTMKSTTGFVIMLYGGVISYMAKLQSTVALSTAEAETNAAVEAVKQLCHIRLFLTELGVKQDFPSVVYEDNNAVMTLVHGGESTKRTKHYMLKFHFLIEKKLNGVFKMKRVDTNKQLGDTCTKALPYPAFSNYRKWMGVIDWNEVRTATDSNTS